MIIQSNQRGKKSRKILKLHHVFSVPPNYWYQPCLAHQHQHQWGQWCLHSPPSCCLSRPLTLQCENVKFLEGLDHIVVQLVDSELFNLLGLVESWLAGLSSGRTRMVTDLIQNFQPFHWVDAFSSCCYLASRCCPCQWCSINNYLKL